MTESGVPQPTGRGANRAPLNGDSLAFSGSGQWASTDDLPALTKVANLSLYATFGRSITLNQALEVDGQFLLAGGEVKGPGTLTLPNANSSSFSWTGGTIANTVIVGANGVTGVSATISGTDAKSLTGKLDNYGSVAWTGGDILGDNDGSIINELGATFDVQANVNLTRQNLNFVTITNKGTFTKSNGTGNSEFDTQINNTGAIVLSAGTLTVGIGLNQDSGTTSLQGGNLTSIPSIFI
jgi:hypothetical protein